MRMPVRGVFRSRLFPIRDHGPPGSDADPVIPGDINYRYGLRVSKDAQASGFGAYIADAIADAGFTTSTHFARAIDVDPSVVRRWINGQQRPTLRLLERAAPALNRSLNDLVAAAYPERSSEAVQPIPLHPLARDVDVLLGANSRLPEKEREALETVLRRLLEPYRSGTPRRKTS